MTISDNYQSFIKSLCDKYGLVIRETIGTNTYTALNNDGIYRVCDTQGKILILKTAIMERSIAEINMNMIGYQKLRDIGLGWIIPEILATELNEYFAVMLMEDCGENFSAESKKSADPIDFYSRFLKELLKIYSVSRYKGEEGKKMILWVITRVIELYEEYIYMHIDKERHLAEQLRLIISAIKVDDIRFYCFSSWDFVPENICLTPNGIKYIDPRENIMGIPIIDMSCFAGLVKLYNLPQAEKGYDMIAQFALTEIPAILLISEELAQKIFYLGRLFQCFMSARFRVINYPFQAQQLFLEGKKYLEKIINV